MKPFTFWPDTPIDGDQDDQCWRDVEAETGFSSYTSFVESLAQSGQRSSCVLLDWLKSPGSTNPVLSELVVLDIHKDWSSVTSLRVQGTAFMGTSPTPSFIRDSGPNLDASRKMSTRILQTLRSPLGNVSARIVLWSMPRHGFPHRGAIEALGLGLDIHPSYFAFLSRNRGYEEEPHPIGLGHIMIDDSIATVARNYRREGRAPPVLVIAGYFDLNYCVWFSPDYLYEPLYTMVQEVMEQEICTSASLYRSAIDKRPLDDSATVPSNSYLKLLSKYVHKDCKVDSEDEVLLLTAVLPLLRLEVLRLRVQCQEVNSVLLRVQFLHSNHYSDFRDDKKQKEPTDLDEQRFWLRRRLESLHESRDAFVKLARSQGAAPWLKSKTWVSQEENISEALAKARVKEAEVQDYMQLQIENLSILESRKSIQLSNR